jgi:hypothetical protein
MIAIVVRIQTHYIFTQSPSPRTLGPHKFKKNLQKWKKKEKKWGSIPIIMMTFPFMISSKTKSVNWIKRTPELSYKKC